MNKNINKGNWICFGYKNENETISGVIQNISNTHVDVLVNGIDKPLSYSKNDIFVLMCE